MIKDLEDDVDEFPDSYFCKAAARLFYKIDIGMDVVLSLSNFVDFIGTLEEDFHSEYLAGNMQKLDPNEIGSLDRFDFR